MSEANAAPALEKKVVVRQGENRITLHAAPGAQMDLQELLCDFERAILKAYIDSNGGVKQRAASQLGLNRTTLVEKCRKYDLYFTPQRR